MSVPRPALRTTIAALLCLLVAGPLVRSQGRRPMTLIDEAQLQRILGPQLSPDGRTLAYMLTVTDWKQGRLIYHLWRQDVAGGAPVQLTFNEAGNIPVIRWSPDGKTILFLRAGQIMLLPIEGGEPRALTKHATAVSNLALASPMWSPDGTTVYFMANDPTTADERERDRLGDDLYAVDETVSQGNASLKNGQVWKINVATGVETQITSGTQTVREFKLSGDGKKIVLMRWPSNWDLDAYRGEIWVMDSDGQNAKALTSNTIQEFAPELSPDNTQVLFTADSNEQFEPYYPTNLFVVPAAGGTPRAVVPDSKYMFDSATWTADGRSILATVNLGVHNEFVLIDVASGRARQLTTGEHYIPNGWMAVRSAGRLMFQMDEPTRFGDVWTLPLDGTQSAPVRVTRHFDALARDFVLPKQEKAEWKGADGVTIEGILFYPTDYTPGQRYPLIVQLHGGPMESDKFGIGAGMILFNVPALTGHGYFVLRPNYRGSGGYGVAFARDVVNGYFHQMAPDVLLGVDALIARGLVDKDRLVLTGWSAGGTLVNKLITMTDRFKVASSGSGVANWISLYAQTDNISFRRSWFGGTPWRKDAPFDLFWNASPLKDVANVKTPTLFFTGDRDIRVGLAQSIEMYRALKSLDVPTQLNVAPGEGHIWGGIRHQLRKANIELEWFEKYANQRAYIWEKVPTS
jgi:dipeptidyl aminopeptidase/acylaminoacyl peptidase